MTDGTEMTSVPVPRRVKEEGIERKATLLHEEEWVTLRSLHQSLDMTGIGARLLWEHRNENKYELVGRFLACFRSPLP